MSIHQTPLVGVVNDEVINDFSEAEMRSNLLAIINSPVSFDTDLSREELSNPFDRDCTFGQTEANRPIDEQIMDCSRFVSVLEGLTQNFQEIQSMTNDPELRAACRIIASKVADLRQKRLS